MIYCEVGGEFIRFYYKNCMGDSGHFTDRRDNIVHAIYSAWNIEAYLYVAETCKEDKRKETITMIFSPQEDNEVNNELLKPYGLYMVDGEKYRELHWINDGSLARNPDDWSGLRQLN